MTPRHDVLLAVERLAEARAALDRAAQAAPDPYVAGGLRLAVADATLAERRARNIAAMLPQQGPVKRVE